VKAKIPNNFPFNCMAMDLAAEELRCPPKRGDKSMARKDPTRNGIIETASEATSAENSKDSLVVLIASLTLFLIATGILFWYFGIYPFHHAPTATTG
jgi:hypothetical protein